MDWLDKLSITVLVGCTLITIGMLANHEMLNGQRENPGLVAAEEKGASALQVEIDKKIYQEVISYKEQGQYSEAMAKLKEIMERYPENARSYVYLAELHLEQGGLADGIHNYRKAVEMEPDYVDEKAPSFIGDQIKELVTEGREKFGREKTLKPKDKKVRKALEDVYYLQRRLAGGCE